MEKIDETGGGGSATVTGENGVCTSSAQAIDHFPIGPEPLDDYYSDEEDELHDERYTGSATTRPYAPRMKQKPQKLQIPSLRPRRELRKLMNDHQKLARTVKPHHGFFQLDLLLHTAVNGMKSTLICFRNRSMASR